MKIRAYILSILVIIASLFIPVYSEVTDEQDEAMSNQADHGNHGVVFGFLAVIASFVSFGAAARIAYEGYQHYTNQAQTDSEAPGTMVGTDSTNEVDVEGFGTVSGIDSSAMSGPEPGLGAQSGFDAQTGAKSTSNKDGMEGTILSVDPDSDGGVGGK